MTELDPEGLVAALADHEVDYVLIGAFAAVLQGSPLPTQDVDICPDIAGHEVKAASLHDVIRSKQSAAREADLRALPILRKLLERRRGRP